MMLVSAQADNEDMGSVSRRTLVHWAKALCIRADMADNAEVRLTASKLSFS